MFSQSIEKNKKSVDTRSMVVWHRINWNSWICSIRNAEKYLKVIEIFYFISSLNKIFNIKICSTI